MSLFHYVTYKYIIIKDKRLGLAYYILAALIILYTIIQLFVIKAYLQYDTSLDGSMRILVNTPLKLQSQENDFEEDPQYCCSNKSIDVSSCGKCRKLDGLSLNWPVEARAVTLATFVKEKWQKIDCEMSMVYNPDNIDIRFEALRENEYYSVNPEFSLIKIEHSITAFGGTFAESHRRMSGRLIGADGSVIKRLNSKGVSKVDKIFLRDFLKASDISLDSISDALNAKNRTFRQNGLILHVSIVYNNSEKSWFGVSNPEYTYKVRRVPYSDYRLKQEVPIANQQGLVCERIVNKRYAVRVEFHQNGKIGKMSWSNVVLQLVSLMGLLTLTATIIDVVALYVIPNKENYRQYVFDHSPEFSDPSQEKDKNL